MECMQSNDEMDVSTYYRPDLKIQLGKSNPVIPSW